jgi:cytochrome bd ubiquinol oxidase subunit I
MFPVWEVPNTGSGWIIGITAILHVFISHFAIGGGAFLAFTEQLAYKKNDDRIYNYLKKHTKFFLLLTTVLGALSGVGIWWSIGLASPNGTQTLLQNFSLFWAVEYVFFALELAILMAYYYTWDKVDRKTHLKLAWMYVAVSYFTLFAINGILTFMLTSGGWNYQMGNIGDAFFNPGFWPALGLRTFIMLALAGIFALFTASRLKGMDDVKAYLLKYSAKWMLPALILGPLFVIAYLFALPEPTQQLIISGLSSIGEGNFSVMAKAIFLALTFAVGLFGMVLVGPYLNPRAFSTSFAAMCLAAGFGFMFMEEWSREMMRKPYVVYNYMYSNGLRTHEIDQVNAEGYFNYNKFAQAEKTTLASSDEVGEGQLMFRYQCASCHTSTGNGYRSMTRLLGVRDKDAISNLLTLMKNNHKIDPETGKPMTMYHGYMPPVVGHQEELDALATYLATLNSDPSTNSHVAVAASDNG